MNVTRSCIHQVSTITREILQLAEEVFTRDCDWLCNSSVIALDMVLLGQGWRYPEIGFRKGVRVLRG